MLTADQIQAQARTAIARCRKLATFSEEPGRITRTFLSPPMHDCHREILAWLSATGVQTSIDAAGNLRALYPGATPQAPRLLIGSHLDTVPDAGAFDGILGVVLGVALLETLNGERLPFAIELLGFSEEEGVRFSIPFIGSRALAGSLDDNTLSRADAAGISIAAAVERFGLNPLNISGAALRGDILGYLEFHIEQGPVLEELDLPLAAVEAIVGQSRLEFAFFGRANHAGTTPMHLRRDALAAAAEWMTAVEREAQSIPGLVATVGAIHTKPGATNVIPGETTLSLDVRHGSDDARNTAVETMIRVAEDTAARRKLDVRHRMVAAQSSVPMDPFLIGQVEQAIRHAGCTPHHMVSGAGHDAMILAEKVPAAMIFLRTPGGISHNPAETVQVEDVEKAIRAGLHLLHQLAALPTLPSRRVHVA